MSGGTTRRSPSEPVASSARRLDGWLARCDRPWSFPAALVLVAVGLGLFVFVSSQTEFAGRGLLRITEENRRPPIYGKWEPRIALTAAAAIAVAAGSVILAARLTRLREVRAAWFLPGAVLFMFGFAFSVALIRGEERDLTIGLATRTMREDVDLVQREVGISRLIREYPDRVGELTNIHARSHPPGRVAGLVFLQRLSPDNLVARSALLAGLSALVVVPLWFIATRLANVRIALYAVLLLIVSPGPVMFTVVSPEAAAATVWLTAMAFLVRGGVWQPGRLRYAVAGGAILGGSTLFSYAGAFTAAAAGLLAVFTRPFRNAAGVLAAAAVGGVAAIALLRLTLGFDLIGSYQASHAALLQHPNWERVHGYWLLGNPSAWLIYAGVPIAGLALRELVFKRPPLLLALLLPLTAFYALPQGITGILPGETERTLAFAYPYAAIAAAVGVVRWLRGDPSRERWLGPLLVAIAAAQTLTMQSLWDNFW